MRGEVLVASFFRVLEFRARGGCVRLFLDPTETEAVRLLSKGHKVGCALFESGKCPKIGGRRVVESVCGFDRPRPQPLATHLAAK